MDHEMKLQPYEFWFYAWLIEVKGIKTTEEFEQFSEEEFNRYLNEYRRSYDI